MGRRKYQFADRAEAEAKYDDAERRVSDYRLALEAVTNNAVEYWVKHGRIRLGLTGCTRYDERTLAIIEYDMTAGGKQVQVVVFDDIVNFGDQDLRRCLTDARHERDLRRKEAWA